MDRIRLFVKSFVGMLFFIVILFASAGRLDYSQGWIYFALSLFGMAMNFAFAGNDNELLKERTKPPKDAKEWDKLILKLSALVAAVAYAVAGLSAAESLLFS